jgi:hypothetical protein
MEQGLVGSPEPAGHMKGLLHVDKLRRFFYRFFERYEPLSGPLKDSKLIGEYPD